MPNEIEVNKQDNLVYEFVCYYNDGHSTLQKFNTPEELQFKDIDQDKLILFELTDGQRSYTVNFQTGEFNLNGTIVNFDLGEVVTNSEGNTYKIFPEKYRLIYFRRVRKDFTPDQGIITSIRFAFGWQTYLNGVNHQRIAIIEPNNTVTFINKK